MSTILLACGLSAAAQESVEYENVFEPHWYVGIQVGGQYTLGETSFGDLLSPNAQLSVGYRFNPVLGLRLGVNAWQSKGGLKGNYVSGSSTSSFEYNWKYKYVAPNIDVVANISNLICGYNPDRLVNVSAFAGIGLNIAFDNDEANDVSATLNRDYPYWTGTSGQNLGNLWDGTAVRLQGRAGLMVDFRVTDKVSVGLEANANILNDRYNSKKAGNADWYFNALAGVKFALGNTNSKREVKKAAPQVIERVVEKIVEKPVEKVVTSSAESSDALRLDVFFTISSTSVSSSEMLKVREIADYLKKNPDAKVEITGYADKGTGTSDVNMKLSEKRANIVVQELKKLGISEDRISSTSYKGDTVQPFGVNDLNRVSICVVK